MITRRRGRSEMQSLKIEVTHAAETDEKLPSPSDGFLADDVDAAGIELDDLFGIEDLKWTLEKDATSPLFGIDLADFGVLSPKDPDSGVEASTGSSPDRMQPDSKIKNRQNQTRSVINKNAIAARLNRLKKKEYVNSLEKKVGVLLTENNGLKQENNQLTKRVEELEDETRGTTQTTMTTRYRGSV